MKARTLGEIEIYREALRLAQLVYHLCKLQILTKEFSLIDQIKRAALSIAANIAEGYGRKTQKDFAQFLSVALGSCNEVIAYLDFIKLEFRVNTDELKPQYEILAKRIYTFRSYLLTSHN